jgi:hypothetical protein
MAFPDPTVLPPLTPTRDRSLDHDRATLAGILGWYIRDDPEGFGNALDVAAEAMDWLEHGTTPYGGFTSRCERLDIMTTSALAYLAGILIRCTSRSAEEARLIAATHHAPRAGEVVTFTERWTRGEKLDPHKVADAIKACDARDRGVLLWLTARGMQRLRLTPADVRGWAATALLLELALP